MAIRLEEHGVTLTAKELIEELQKLPEDMPVITQGCDCDGPARLVAVQGGVAKIERHKVGEL